MRRNSWF